MPMTKKPHPEDASLRLAVEALGRSRYTSQRDLGVHHDDPEPEEHEHDADDSLAQGLLTPVCGRR